MPSVRHLAAPQRSTVLLAGILIVGVAAVVAVPGSPAAADRLLDGPLALLPLLFAAAFGAHRYPVQTVWAIAAFLVLNGYTFAHQGLSLRTPTQGLVLALLLAAVWGRFTRPTPPPIALPGLLLLGLYMAVSALMILLAPSLSLGFAAYREQLVPFLLLPALAIGPWTPEQLRRMVAGVLVSVIAGGLYAMLRQITGPDAAELAIARETSHRVAGVLSLYGSFVSRQDLSSWASVSGPFLVALLPVLHGRWRIASFAGVLMCAVAVLGTDVRVGLVSLVVGSGAVLGVFALTRLRTPEVGRIVGVFVVVALAGGLAYGATVSGDSAASSRFEAVLNPNSDFSFSRRQDKWADLVPDISARPIGHGLGTAGSVVRTRGRFYTPDHYSIDNAYLQLSYQQGWYVVALFVGALALLLIGLSTTLMHASPGTAAVRAGAIGSLTAWAIALGAGDYLETGGTFMAMLVVGLAVVGGGALVPGDQDGSSRRRKRSSSAAGASPSRWAAR